MQEFFEWIWDALLLHNFPHQTWVMTKYISIFTETDRIWQQPATNYKTWVSEVIMAFLCHRQMVALFRVFGLLHTKRSLIAWVVVIPKEGWVWQRLFRFFLESQCHTTCFHHSFGMITTQDIRDLFAWCRPLLFGIFIQRMHMHSRPFSIQFEHESWTQGNRHRNNSIIF